MSDKKLTAFDRAGLIGREIFCYDDEDLGILIELTAEQIKSAENAAREEGKLGCIAHAKESYCPACDGDFKRGFKEGFRAGIEAAANRVGPHAECLDGCDSHDHDKLCPVVNCYEAILALSPDSGGKGD